MFKYYCSTIFINLIYGVHYVENTDSNRDEIRLRSNNVCNEQVTEPPEVDMSKLIETLDCE